MLISTAYAQAIDGAGGSSFLIQAAPILMIVVVFYFLLFRPQQKKQKEHRAMIEALRRGDRVITSGGLIGTVSKVNSDTEVSLEIADNVRVRVARAMIAQVMARTEPASAKEDKKAEAREEPENNYYKILGLSRNASVAEIAAANHDSTAAQEAYETLKDPTKRKLYDSLGHDDYVSRVKG
jgi:preprotein translocase subunit YajC